MAFCSKCGGELPAGVRLCPACGAAAAEQSPPPSDAEPQNPVGDDSDPADADVAENGGAAPPPPLPPAGGWRSRRRLPLIIAAAVVTIALLVGGVLLLFNPEWEVMARQDGYAVSGESTHHFLAEVANVGRGDGVYEQSYSVDGVHVGDVQADVPSGESVEVRLDVPGDLALGEHTLLVGDSTLTFEVVEPAAFVVRRLKADPRFVRKGGTISVEARVRNTGGAPGTYEKAPRVSGKGFRGEEQLIAPGETETLLFETRASRTGTQTVRLGGESCKVTVCKPVRLSNGATIAGRLSGGLGQLKIKNGNREDGMVVLTKAGSKKVVVSLYVRAKNTFVLKGIPNGKYTLYYSLGKDWNWQMRDFFTVGERSKFSMPFDYSTSASSYVSGNYRYTNTEYTEWSVGLHKVLGGTANTQNVSAGAFPGAK